MQLSKLKWQCRRGTQELDNLLLHYVEKTYLNAALSEQQQFQRLLALEDNELLQLFFSPSDAHPNELTILVEKIRRCARL